MTTETSTPRSPPTPRSKRSSRSRRRSSSAASPSPQLLAEQAKQHLAGGVTSSWQITAPQPVWLSRGRGSKVWDVDGNEYVDLHGGYGAALAGHAHPAIAKAVTDQAHNGAHFAQPTAGRRWRWHKSSPAGSASRSWRSPTPARNHHGRHPPDALITGRDLIIKIEGCYHGHHDSVRSRSLRGRRRRPAGKTQQRPLVLRHPEGHHRPDAGRHVQRPRQRRPPAGRAPGPDRGHDPGAGHDERRDHQARARLPREPQGPAARPRRAAHLRRGQDRPHRRPGRRHARWRASSPTSSAWPSRWAAAWPWPPSAAPPR